MSMSNDPQSHQQQQRAHPDPVTRILHQWDRSPEAREELLPLSRYFAYIETPEDEDSRKSPLWVEYQELEGTGPNFAMRRVSRPSEIYPVFRELFSNERAKA